MPSLEVIRQSLRVMRTITVKYALAPLLSNKARYLAALGNPDMEAKDYQDIVSRMTNLIKAVYNGTIGGEFIDSMAALISRQMLLAYEQAWQDEGEGTDDMPLPDYLSQAADQAAVDQVDFVDGLYQDIIDAKVDQTGVEPLLSRVDLWATRYTEAYNDGIRKIGIETGGKGKWNLGATEQHCASCSALNGIVAYMHEWEASGIKPQNAPNDVLECGGWKCDCSIDPTDERRTRNAKDKLEEIATRTLL